MEVVRDTWNAPLYGSPMAIFCKRLQMVKKGIMALNKKNGNVHNKLKNSKAIISQI